MRLLSVPVVVLVWWVSSPVAAQPASGRQMQEREITLSVADPSAMPEVYVAGERATVLQFGFPIRKDGIHLTGAERMPLPQVSGNRVVLLPTEDIRTEEQATLAVDSTCGASVRFALHSRPDVLDVHVKVSWAGGSPLESRLRETGEALGRCQDKVAGLMATVDAVLREEAAGRRARWEARGGPPVWIAGAREVQLQAMTVYRAGDVLYVAITIESTTIPWVLEGGTLSSAEAGEMETLAIASRGWKLSSLRVVNVLVVRAPPLDKGGRLTAELVAKDGRRVRVQEGEEDVP